MPGLSRSAQVWMFFGLPLRTTNATTDVVTSPLFGPAFQSSDDDPRLDEAGHVGLDREADDVGLLAGLDGAALVAGGAEGRLEADALAGRGLLEVGDDLVVDDLRASSTRRARASCPAAAGARRA